MSAPRARPPGAATYLTTPAKQSAKAVARLCRTLIRESGITPAGGFPRFAKSAFGKTVLIAVPLSALLIWAWLTMANHAVTGQPGNIGDRVTSANPTVVFCRDFRQWETNPGTGNLTRAATASAAAMLALQGRFATLQAGVQSGRTPATIRRDTQWVADGCATAGGPVTLTAYRGNP